MEGLGDVEGQEMPTSSSNPVVFELNRLENNLVEKERELEHAHSEIKAMKMMETVKDKAIVELNNELKRQDESIRLVEKQLEQKNLEIKRLMDEKREAQSAQSAAESTLRRVHATQEDEVIVPVESIIAPLQSDIKRYKTEIAKLREENKALKRITRSREAALVEAGNILRSALERALIVEDVQNQNIELRRKLEIHQEENKLLEKANRKKVVEVEKLTQTVHDLEESILARGTAANAARDYQRQLSALNEEKKALERELARVKVVLNRAAVLEANEWKDDSYRAVPVKQWLVERRFLQGETQRMRDKLVVAEKTAKAENRLNERLKTRLKRLEEQSRNSSSSPAEEGENSKQSTEKQTKTPPSPSQSAQPKAYARNKKRVDRLHAPNVAQDHTVRKRSWSSGRKLIDDNPKQEEERDADCNMDVDNSVPGKIEAPQEHEAARHDEIGQETKGVDVEI